MSTDWEGLGKTYFMTFLWVDCVLCLGLMYWYIAGPFPFFFFWKFFLFIDKLDRYIFISSTQKDGGCKLLNSTLWGENIQIANNLIWLKFVPWCYYKKKIVHLVNCNLFLFVFIICFMIVLVLVLPLATFKYIILSIIQRTMVDTCPERLFRNASYYWYWWNDNSINKKHARAYVKA